MNKRSLLVVASITVVLVVLAVLTQPQQETSTAGTGLLLAGLENSLNEVDEIQVVKAGSETVATLRRSDTGWSVAERDGYAADVGIIREALLALAEARNIENKTSNPDYYDRLGVEPIDSETASGIAVTVTRAGTSLPTIILGATVGTSYRYARRADEELSLLIDRDPEVPRETGQWLVADILDVRGTRVQAVNITHADGESVAIAKASREQANFDVAGVPEDRELQYPGVANVIGNALRELKLEDVRRLDASWEPVVTTEFKTFDGLVITARGFALDDESWLGFTASFDPQQAVDFGTEAVEESLDAVDTGSDPREEAERINSRTAGWAYRIPSFQYDQMTRHMADLLKARS